MKHRSKTSFLLKFLIVHTLAACIFNPGLKAEWGVDQVLVVQIFDAPKGLPENVYYLEHQIRYQGSLEDGLAVGEGRLFWNNGQTSLRGKLKKREWNWKSGMRRYKIPTRRSKTPKLQEVDVFTISIKISRLKWYTVIIRILDFAVLLIVFVVLLWRRLKFYLILFNNWRRLKF